ncbi:hypothetical protein AU255_09620 [Methyloprofundus sedimenti]|uniref:Uncharacterized protein n=1 Tax=Methyloprofundus sedimenti TaxID=1420851 RepID=A0A1V8M9V7_9GAMM|nr:hypothetical protein [Methyloprofundus sedimenti]OQK18083.1 hypothetical protein AU255_09620 [Methyloprofundus sedimenti]
MKFKKVSLIEKVKRYLQKTPYERRNQKRYESDREMLIRVAKKFAILFLVILIFDTLLDWFLGLIDALLHLIHLGIEAIEYSIEIFLEHIFHANHHQSEIIIINGAIMIALYLAHRLYLVFPQLITRFKRNFLALWLKHKRRETFYWRSMPILYKIKWVCAYSFGTTLLLFFMLL